MVQLSSVRWDHREGDRGSLSIGRTELPEVAMSRTLMRSEHGSSHFDCENIDSVVDKKLCRESYRHLSRL